MSGIEAGAGMKAVWMLIGGSVAAIVGLTMTRRSCKQA